MSADSEPLATTNVEIHLEDVPDDKEMAVEAWLFSVSTFWLLGAVMVGTLSAVIVLGPAVNLVQCVLMAFFWTAFYLTFSMILYQITNRNYKLSNGIVSITHQLGVMVVILILILILHEPLDMYVEAGWSGMRFLDAQVLLSVLGYELKDWLAPKALMMSTPFWFHHLFVFVGIGIVFAVPAGAGWLLLNALNAEIGSGAYNIANLTRAGGVSRQCRWVINIAYWLLMTGSNSLAIWMMVQFWSIPMPVVWHAVYAVILVLLVLLRQIGCLLDVMDECTSAKKSSE